MTEFAIDVQDVCCTFGDLQALDRVTLRVRGGTVFGLLGPNGAGKTTTIRLLLGLVAATSGHARVLGLDLRAESAAVRCRTGALLEHTGLYERLSAEDNLDFYGRVWRLPRVERQERIRELLTEFGLWDRRHDIVARWSRGMKQKLAVARAMLHRPHLLLLDEPTAGLDPVASAALRDDLASLVTRERVTVLLTTHNLVEAERLCAEIGVLSRGRLLAVGTPADVRSDAVSLEDAFCTLIREAS
jgi:ABC-2 type transport system ATP-binding protein